MVYAGHYGEFWLRLSRLKLMKGRERKETLADSFRFVAFSSAFFLSFSFLPVAAVVGSGRDVRRVPTVVVVKCGMPAEASEKKPGNRGKRDSQLILMNFFSRVTYNDRMSPLDFDLFRKIQVLMGVTPDFFEVCLMVSLKSQRRRANRDASFSNRS